MQCCRGKMEWFSATVSVSFIVCVTLALISCASCKKIFKQKKKNDKKADEENGDIIGSEDAKLENGISNPAYNAAANQEYKDPLKQEGQQDEPNLTQDQENTSLTIEDECCRDQAKHEILPNGNVEPVKNAKEEENVCSEDTQAPQPRSSVESESSIHPFKFSESIRSSDVANLSSALDGKTRETIIEEENAAPPSNVFAEDEHEETKPDWSRFDDVVFQGGWRRDVKLTDLLEMKLIDENVAEEIIRKSEEYTNEDSVHETLKPYLYGESPVAGILLSETGETKSIFRSAKEGILRRGTAISLLEAQAATGNIIDPVTGRKMSVSEGFQLGLLDKVYETVVSRAERAVTGYKSRVTDEIMSLGQAMERGLVIESHGIRLLEAQLATGGIIDHKSNVKLPIKLAIERGLLAQQLADKLEKICEDIPDEQKSSELKTFFDPNTEENVTYCELMKRSVVDDDTGMRLYHLEKIGRRRFSYASYSGRSSLASSRASSRESIPAALAAEK